MELDEVEAVGAQVLEAAVDEGGEVSAVVALGGVGIESAAGFGGDVDGVAGAFFAELGDEAFGAAVAIDVGCVDEIHSRVDGRVERLQ